MIHIQSNVKGVKKRFLDILNDNQYKIITKSRSGIRAIKPKRIPRSDPSFLKVTKKI